jgi:hypothetical protein
MSVDEGLLHAWLDGQLPPDDAARIERLVAEDPAWRDAAAEARGLIAASARVLGALDAAPSAQPVTGGGSGAAASSRGREDTTEVTRVAWHVAPWMRIAAGIALVVGVGSVVWDRAPQTLVETAPSVAPQAVAAIDSVPEAMQAVPVPAEAPAEGGRVAAAALPRPPAAAELATAATARAAAPTMALAGKQSEAGVAVSTQAAPVPAICLRRLTQPADTALLRVQAWTLAPDSALRAMWTEPDGRTSFSGRLHGDTLRGSSRTMGGDLRLPLRADTLLRVPCA